MPSRGGKRPFITGRPRRGSRPARADRDANKEAVEIATWKRNAGNSTARVAHPLVVMPALREVHRRLTEVRAAALTVSLALQEQNADFDREIADTVRISVTYKLDALINSLESVLGIGPNVKSGSGSETSELSSVSSCAEETC